MPIDKNRKIIYLHPAKTGGTSLAKMFGWMGGGLNHLVGGDPNNTGIFLGTLPLRYFKRYVDISDFKNYFKFITVRNPYTRAASDYIFRPGPHRPKTFYEYLRIVEVALKKYSIDDLISLDGTPILKNHLIPQAEYIRCDDDLKNEGITEDTIVILKMESLDQDFDSKVNEPLGLNLKMTHDNKGSGSLALYKSFYKDTDGNLVGATANGNFVSNADLVKQLYSEDFQTFNYSTNII
jgi:hypothetical protein